MTSKKYYGSNMDNYSNDFQLWQGLSESVDYEDKKKIMKKFVKAMLSPIRITTRERIAYIMKYYEHKSNAEIADIMKISTKTVKNHIYSANKKLEMIAKSME